MDGPLILVPLLGIIGVFSIPIVAIVTSHRRNMLELQHKLKQQSSSVNDSSVEALREEIRALRETTTQYDISFDTAMQRLERRIETLERQRIGATEEQADLQIVR